MRLKLIFQIFIILTIFTILAVFYFSFIFQDKNKELNTSKMEKEVDISLNEKISSELENIEYNSIDDIGNKYYIYAERAVAEINDETNNKVKLYGVVSVINLKDRGIINISAKNAIYNKINNNTLFFNNVRMDYLNKSMFSQNLDIIFTEKKSKIYNNVIYKTENFTLNTDEVFIDMITGDIKLQMVNKTDKIKIKTSNELIN